MEAITYGYARISTPKQNIERQARNILEAYPDARIVREIYTGTKFQGRKEFDNRILKKLKPGDRIVFDEVSRMSRDADEGCSLYEDLFRKGINLIFLKEPHINTEVYRETLQKQINIYIDTGNAATDKFLNAIMDALNQFVIDLAKEQIRLAFEQAEKEVRDLKRRTSEGIQTAKLNGKQIGRIAGRKYTTKKEKMAKEVILKYSRDFNGSNRDPEVIKIAGISRNSYYKYKSELKAMLEKEKGLENEREHNLQA